MDFRRFLKVHDDQRLASVLIGYEWVGGGEAGVRFLAVNRLAGLGRQVYDVQAKTVILVGDKL